MVHPMWKNICSFDLTNYPLFDTDPTKIEIVILGQDPYPSNQSDGLAFSVPPEQKIPGSLRNIFKEIELEFPERKYNFTSGSLKKWSSFIFLLNCSLDLKDSKAKWKPHIINKLN